MTMSADEREARCCMNCAENLLIMGSIFVVLAVPFIVLHFIVYSMVFFGLFIAFLVAGIICLAGGVYLCKKFKSETWEDGQPIPAVGYDPSLGVCRYPAAPTSDTSTQLLQGQPAYVDNDVMKA